jgi:hypothetical protein
VAALTRASLGITRRHSPARPRPLVHSPRAPGLCFHHRPARRASLALATSSPSPAHFGMAPASRRPSRVPTRGGPNMRSGPPAHAHPHTCFSPPALGAPRQFRSPGGPPPARPRLSLPPQGPPRAHAFSSRWPVHPVLWCLTIRCGWRAGHGSLADARSYSLRPQPNSSVRHTNKDFP